MPGGKPLTTIKTSQEKGTAVKLLIHWKYWLQNYIRPIHNILNDKVPISIKVWITQEQVISGTLINHSSAGCSVSYI